MFRGTLTDVFASSMWTWDSVAGGGNVLRHHLACQVIEFFGLPSEIDLAGEFLIIDWKTGVFE